MSRGFGRSVRGFDILASGLDKFAKGFDRFASGFLSIFNTGFVRFLMELFSEKPVIPEALVLELYSNAQTELEIKYTTSKHKSAPVDINQLEFIGDLLKILLMRFSFDTFAMPVNIQYITLNYLPCRRCN